jgi:hypothetical protein
MRYYPTRIDDKVFYFSRSGEVYGPTQKRYALDEIEAARKIAMVEIERRRKEAAARAAQTRHQRKEAHYYAVADQLIRGITFGPHDRCRICKKALTEQQSRLRGIGPECWERVVSIKTELQAKAAAATAA